MIRLRNIPGSVLFIIGVALVYGFLFAVAPDKAFTALGNSGKMVLNILIPLGFVFLILTMLNLFIKPDQVVRLFGKGSGVRGVVLAATAGILSMGPIYAWYPLLKEMKEKGAKNALIAVFLANRAVKPFLLPVMISYFGLIYVLILTVFMVCSSLAVGRIVGALVKDR